MFTAIKNWFTNNSKLTHFFASLFTFVTTAYIMSSTFHDYVNTTAMSIYHHMPPWLAQFTVGAIVPLYFLYRQQLSARGKLVLAQKSLVQEAQKGPAKDTGVKLPAYALICLTISSLCVSGTIGCTSADAQKAAQLISGALPGILSAEQAVAALLLIDPAIGVPLQAVQPIITAGITELENLLQQYETNPTNSAWASIVGTVDKLVQGGDQQLLAAGQIKDASSQAKATALLGALDALLHVIDGYVQQTQTTAQVKHTMQARKVKARQVMSLLTPQQRETVARAYGLSVPALEAAATQRGF